MKSFFQSPAPSSHESKIPLSSPVLLRQSNYIASSDGQLVSSSLEPPPPPQHTVSSIDDRTLHDPPPLCSDSPPGLRVRGIGNTLHDAHSLNELAPSGVSAWSGPTVEILSGSSDRISVHFKVPFGTLAAPGIVQAATASLSWPALIQTAKDAYASPAVTQIAETVALSPTLLPSVITNVSTALATRVAYMDCNLVALVSAPFSKYRMKGDMKLHYMPQTTTIDPTAFALTVTDDPMHPQAGFGAYTTPAATGAVWPSFSTVKNSTNSIVFASWSTWSKSFAVDNDAVYFTTTPLADSLSIAGTIGSIPPFDDANLRFSHFGALTCYANGPGSDNLPQAKGELYIEATIEFFDFVPVVGTNSTPFSLIDWYMAQNELVRLQKQLKRALVNCPPSDDTQIALCDGSENIFIPPRPMFPADHKSGSHYRAAKLTVKKPGLPRANKLVRTSAAKRPALTNNHLIRIVQHLHSQKSKLPKAAQHKVGSLVSASKEKKPGWHGIVKTGVKSLVSEVPVVGKILAGLTDVIGDPLLDFLGSLF